VWTISSSFIITDPDGFHLLFSFQIAWLMFDRRPPQQLDNLSEIVSDRRIDNLLQLSFSNSG
jgi:hypothetical protein